MKALLAGTVIAEADDADLITIEGNKYFPPNTVRPGLLTESPTPYTCPWKGECQYFNIVLGDDTHTDMAWSYPHPYPGAFERVGKDFSGYIAFSPAVEVRAS